MNEDRANSELAAAIRERDEARRERDAYKRAKSENDERFMCERDEARRERDQLRALVDDAVCFVRFHVDDGSRGWRARYEAMTSAGSGSLGTATREDAETAPSGSGEGHTYCHDAVTPGECEEGPLGGWNGMTLCPKHHATRILSDAERNTRELRDAEIAGELVRAPTFAQAVADAADALPTSAEDAATIDRLMARHAGEVRLLPRLADDPVCSTCNDTHRMDLTDGHGDSRVVPCTQCPVPCERCRSQPQGVYCAQTPCGCECHGSSKPPRFLHPKEY